MSDSVLAFQERTMRSSSPIAASPVGAAGASSVVPVYGAPGTHVGPPTAVPFGPVDATIVVPPFSSKP
jgi:hypothetical protein